jgi:hypothetical protein
MEMCPRQDVVPNDIRVIAAWVDNDLLSHGRSSSWSIYVARQCEPGSHGISDLPPVLWSATVVNDSVAGLLSRCLTDMTITWRKQIDPGRTIFATDVPGFSRIGIRLSR